MSSDSWYAALASMSINVCTRAQQQTSCTSLVLNGCRPTRQTHQWLSWMQKFGLVRLTVVNMNELMIALHNLLPFSFPQLFP